MNTNSSRNKEKHQSKIIWFNPTFSKSLKTNLGKIFFKVSKRHEMSMIFNKNTIKLGYSFCRNISSKISTNNRRIVNPPHNNYASYCRNKPYCPLDNKCLTPSIVYKAIISPTSKPDKKYLKYLKLLSKTVGSVDTKKELIKSAEKYVSYI